MGIENSFKDQEKRKFWEKYSKSRRKKVVTDEMQSMNGPVRRICIRCKTAEINKHSPRNIKMCRDCYSEVIKGILNYENTENGKTL